MFENVLQLQVEIKVSLTPSHAYSTLRANLFFVSKCNLCVLKSSENFVETYFIFGASQYLQRLYIYAQYFLLTEKLFVQLMERKIFLLFLFGRIINLGIEKSFILIRSYSRLVLDESPKKIYETVFEGPFCFINRKQSVLSIFLKINNISLACAL